MIKNGILCLLVDNHFGVLTKVTGLFGRRGFNIKALSVGETENSKFSRITVLTEGDDETLAQIYEQVLKLEEVRRAEMIPDDGLVTRELALIKLSCGAKQIETAVNGRGAKICAAGNGFTIIEYCATAAEINELIEQIRPFGIIEMSRTGITALEISNRALCL